MSRYSITVCDLCGDRILTNGIYKHTNGVLKIRAKEFEPIKELSGAEWIIFPKWKRRVYHICPVCVGKLKDMTKKGDKSHE